MKLSEVCIERPVFAWVMTLVLILVGIVLGMRLPLQEYPKFEQPSVTVETNLPGAGPEIIEMQITKELEEAFSGIEGIDHMSSNSNLGKSTITLVFRQERNLDEAVNDIRDCISRKRNSLPPDTQEPTIRRVRHDESAIMTLAFSSKKMTRSELFDFVDQEVKKNFDSVPGVGRVEVYGEGNFVMNIYVDPKRMASYGLTVDEVTTAIRGQNTELPGGRIISKNREYLVTTVASLEKPEQFENTIVLSKNGRLIRLSDIGRAEIESVRASSRSYFNGCRGVSLSITKQSDANPISVANGVKKEIENVKKTLLSDDIQVTVSYDSTLYVKRSLKEVTHTIFESVVLVVVIVLIFLRSFSAALIPLVTIPVSLIGTMIFMYAFGFSLNIFTLLAFVLAIGLVVDDAIVVLENVHRYLEMGYSRMEAAVRGIREVSFAVIAMTLTLAAVYAPVALATGITGKLLTEFSITLACSVILSGFAALTLSPMMCAKILDKPSGDTVLGDHPSLGDRIKSFVPIDSMMARLSNAYERGLRIVLNHKVLVMGCAFVFALLGVGVYLSLPSQLFPKADTGTITLDGHAPQSSTLEYTERYVQELDALIADIPEIQSRDINIKNPRVEGTVTLKEKRKRSSDEVAKEIRKRINDITGVDILRIEAGRGGASGSTSTVSFVVRGNKSHKELRDLARGMGHELMRSGLVAQVLTQSDNDAEDYTVTILRDKALSLSIEPKTIAQTIDALIRGHKVNTFKKDNKLYDVKIEVENEARSAPDDILNIHVKGGERKDKLIPLSELIQITPRSGPSDVYHYNRTRAVRVDGYLKPGQGVNDGIAYVEASKSRILPTDAVLEFVGTTRQFMQENRVMALVFGLAVLFIYLVMAAQFESWRDPLIILFSVPLAIISAVLTLAFIENGSLNLYSNIGLLTLIGLITKHGILIVDFANKKQVNEKLGIREAIVQAALVRLRPVIMTTLAMVLGALPLALATGAGAESRWQLGWTIVGGMTLGTVFTLFIVPVFYVLMSKAKKPLEVISISKEKVGA